jgi:hypothetical protein
MEESENIKDRPLLMAIFLTAFIMFTPCWIYGRISLQEREALAALYNKTGGRNWLQQKNWNQAPGSENTWQGITCDAANTTVLKIEMPGNRLQGVLPLDLQVFANLTTLDLSNNRLSGAIPRWIESLKNLKKLDLGNNDFSGPIPAWLGSLKNLEELVLDNNRLEGAIPKELAHLVNLKVLRLAGNFLTGVIPAELVQLVNLEDNRSDFRWNGLSPRETSINEFLRKKQTDGDWESTQTTPPSDIEAQSAEDTIMVRWLPIPYTAGTGGYRVFYREEGQSYHDQFVEDVSGKRATEVSLKRLKKSTLYHFKICTWTGSHSNNKNRIDSPLSDERSMATRGIIISGTIINKKDGEGVAGVLLTASNDGGTAETDKDGIYRLSVMPGWTGTVTPYREGFTFSPLSMNYDREITEDISGNDYNTESGKVISGSVKYKERGIGGVILKFTGDNGEKYSVLTNENGDYKQEVPYNWSGSVTPIKDRHGFYPEIRKYEKITSFQENQGYAVRLPKIFGQVKMRGGKGVGGVKLNFSKVGTDKFDYLNDYAVTDDKGNYENDVLKNWKGRVTPEPFPRSRYFFQPYSREIERIDDAKNLDFKAWRYYKYFLQITCNLMRYDDYDYYFVGGSTLISPEITLGFHAIRGCYIFSGVEFIYRRLHYWKSHWIWLQQLYSIGIAFYYEDKRSYFRHMTPYFRVTYELGVVHLRYQEGTFENRIQFKNWGGIAGINIFYNYNDRWFTSFKLGYMYTYHFSGIKVGVSLLGYRF